MDRLYVFVCGRKFELTVDVNANTLGMRKFSNGLNIVNTNTATQQERSIALIVLQDVPIEFSARSAVIRSFCIKEEIGATTFGR